MSTVNAKIARRQQSLDVQREMDSTVLNLVNARGILTRRELATLVPYSASTIYNVTNRLADTDALVRVRCNVQVTLYSNEYAETHELESGRRSESVGYGPYEEDIPAIELQRKLHALIRNAA